jgi:mannan endo-1,4-beta-mannosidase
MPQTITLGSNGQDVILLQTTLNDRPPTALPPLLVDGNFDPVTLERVKEFQTNNGLFVDGIVSSITWGKLLEDIPPQKQTFHTQGRHLHDFAGNKVILRGVNKMSVFDNEDPVGSISFPEIRKTGANSVRIVWAIRTKLGPTDPTRLDALITTAKANHLIPLIELHDATGVWRRLPDLIDYWTQPEIVSIIQKHEEYLLINIANEAGEPEDAPDHDPVSEDQFIEGYSQAIQRMRTAGIHTPLVVDASMVGKNLDRLDATADRLIAADPEKNMLFSVHLYWPKFGGADANFIRSKLEHSVSLGYPLIVGEFSGYGGWAGLDENNVDENGEKKPKSVCSPDGEIDYKTIIEVCHQNEIGWYVWEWGPGNDKGDPPDPLCVVMDMTPDRLFVNLKPEWAEEVAISSPFSIKNTSITPPTM